MENCLKAFGAAVAVLCATLAAAPGRAQEDAPNMGSERDAAPVAAKSGVDAKGNDSADRGVGQNHLRGGDTAHPGPATDQGVSSDHGVSSIKPNESLAVLLRRANRRTSVATTPSAGPSAPAGGQLSFTHPGRDGGAMRNAIGAVVPSIGQGAGTVPGLMTRAGGGANGPGPGAIGTAAGNAGSGQRPAIPLSVGAGPAAHPGGLNGTTMGRNASGPGYVGGPAKDRSGINGTAMRPKQ